jgi:Phage endonuclease I
VSILFESQYRSGLERKIAAQFKQHGVALPYEKVRLPYDVPARTAHYIPDWVDQDRHIIVEGKGRFGHQKSDAQGAKEREKLCLVQEQYPDWTIHIIFENASKKIYKGSKTTYEKWATDHGFSWSDKGVVPQKLIDILKAKPKGKS